MHLIDRRKKYFCLLLLMLSCTTPDKIRQEELNKEEKITVDKVMDFVKKSISNYLETGNIEDLNLSTKKINTIYSLIKRRTKYSNEFFYIGLLKEILKDIDGAVENYSILLKRNKRHVQGVINISQIYIEGGHYKKALGELKKVRNQINKKNISDKTRFKYYYTLSWAYLKANSIKNAKTIALDTIRSGFRDPEIYILLSEIFKAENNYSMAIYALDRGVKSNPNSPELYLLKSNLSNINEEKINLLKIALEKDNYYFFARNAIIKIFLDDQKCFEAKKVLLNKEVSNINYNLLEAQVYFCLKDYNSAAKTYHKVLKYDPQNIFSIYSLAHLNFIHFNNKKNALNYFKLYLNLLEKIEDRGGASKELVQYYISTIEKDMNEKVF